MSHRKDAMDEEEHKSEAAGMMRWLLTYSDMITLLLGLFIIIAGASKADTAKYNILASQAERVFGAGKSTIFQGQNGSLKGGTGVMPFIGRKESKQAEQPAGVSVVETNVGTKITFSSGILFSAGEADLQPKAKNIIDTIYKMYLNNPNNTIVIKGHTDNRPISSAVYPSN